MVDLTIRDGGCLNKISIDVKVEVTVTFTKKIFDLGTTNWRMQKTALITTAHQTAVWLCGRFFLRVCCLENLQCMWF